MNWTPLLFIAGHALKLLPTGNDYTSEKLWRIHGARTSIYVSAFAFHPDEMGQAYIAHLCERANAGLDVRILVDDLGSRKLIRQRDDLLSRCDFRILAYNPISWGVTRLPHALHEKFLVVDGTTVFVGGSGYATHYFNARRDSTSWHDLDLRIDGPAACWFHEQFIARWKNAAAETRRTSEGWTSDRINMEHGPWDFTGCRGTPMGLARISPVLTEPIFSDERHLLETYLKLITESRASIRIWSPYPVMTPQIENALLAARRRGVRVQVITNSSISTDEGFQMQAAMSFTLEKLIRGGIEVGAWRRSGTLHRKGSLYDGKYVVIGSDNYDRRGHDYSTESVIVSDSPALIRDTEREFALDLGEVDQLNSGNLDAIVGAASAFERWYMALIRRFY